MVLTLLVLLVDASIKSRSQAPVRQLSGQEWVDRVLPLIGQSNVSGRELEGFRSSSSAKLVPATASTDLNAMVNGTKRTYESYLKLTAPNSLAGSAGLLQTSLLVRSQAAAAIAAAVRTQLASPTTTATSSGAQRQITAAVSQLEIADEAYSLFTKRLPSSVGGAPASVWLTDSSSALYAPAKLQVWLAGLHSRISLAAVHRLRVVSLATAPGPVGGSRGTTETLAPGTHLQVTVVVGNVGNQPADNLDVKAAISASTGTASATTVIPSLAAGSDTTVALGALAPRIGVPVTLTVTVSPQKGSPTPAVNRRLVFTMPSPTSSSTTTTTSTPPAPPKSKAKGSTTTTKTGATTTTTKPSTPPST